jgi:hypothetical protein
MYKVVWPSGKSTQQPQTLAPRLGSLEGKTICGLSNGRYYFGETWPLIKKLLSERYQGINFVDWDKFDIIPDKDEKEVLKALPEKLRTRGCDAVISGRGC